LVTVSEQKEEVARWEEKVSFRWLFFADPAHPQAALAALCHSKVSYATPSYHTHFGKYVQTIS
jgi:hypothetical protein